MGNIFLQAESSCLELDEKDGRLLAAGEVDLGSALWELTVQTQKGKERIVPESLPFSYRWDDGVLICRWENERFCLKAFFVTKGGKIHAHMSVAVKDSSIGIDRLVFPIFGDMKPQKNDHLLVPWQNGFLVDDPVRTLLPRDGEAPFWGGRDGRRYESEYPAQFSFQLMAYYGDTTGLYFGVEDSKAYIKTLGMYLEESGERFSFRLTNYPENMGKAQHYEMPYDFVFRTFDGDWQAAVNVYRDWAVRQPWCTKTLREKGIPESIKKTDLWRINHTNYALGKRTEEYIQTTTDMQERLNCRLGLHWYGWNMGFHDRHYPDYINHDVPGWDEQLREYTARLTEKEIVKIPYVNARLWDSHDPSWENEGAEKYALRDEKGDFLDQPWNPDTVLIPMCPKTAMWQSRVAGFCEDYVLNYGFDGIYIDQVASYYASLCFDSSHGHPLGGGSWWNDGYHEMISSVRERVGRDKILTSESCCESYTDVFDMFLILDMNMQHSSVVAGGRNQEALPLFNMIYGDRMLTYGSICLMSNPLPQFEFNMVRNTLWGILPSIDGFEKAELEREDAGLYLEIVRKAVEFYQANKERILYGRPETVLNVKAPEFAVEFSSGSPYIKQYSGVMALRWDCEGTGYIFAYNFLSHAVSAELEGKTIRLEPKQFQAIIL